MKLQARPRHAFLALPALVLAAAPLGAGDPVAKGDAHEAGGNGLVRVLPGAQEAERTEAGTWREALKSGDLDERMQTYEHLIERARSDRATRDLLDELAESDDLELAWTARMARRELRQQGTNGFGVVPFGQWTPRGRTYRFQLPDGFAWPNSRGTPFGDPFGDLEARVRELERMFQGPDEEDSSARPSPLAPANPPGAGSKRSQSYSIQITPQGAKVELREEVDGEEQVRTYEGESLDEILRANPELKDAIGADAGARAFSLGSPRRLEDLRGLQRWFERDGGQAQAGKHAQPPTNILGIEYRAPTPDEVQTLGLETGVGLVVERTVPGTIAHLLGIERGDVLVELNGNRLLGGEDVSRVLRERLPDADVAVSIVDTKGQRRTLTWRPPQREEDF